VALALAKKSSSSVVMAGLDPAIHVFSASRESKTWITATSAVMTPDLRRRIELLRPAMTDC